jgi:Tfp pilus assembly protein PilZ
MVNNKGSSSPPAIVKLRLPNGRHLDAGRVWNVSLGGVFIEMSEPLPFGADLLLEFSLASQSLPVQCKGFVVWSTKDSPEKAHGRRGAAVRLTDLGISQMRAISSDVGNAL